MPLLAPVTTATWFFRLSIFLVAASPGYGSGLDLLLEIRREGLSQCHTYSTEFTLRRSISHLHRRAVSRSCYDGRMRYGSWALRLGSILILTSEALAAQQQPTPKDLPDTPAPKQEQPPRKHDSALHTTFEVLARRSTFFPDLAANPGRLGSKQKLELFVDKSVAPSHFLGSGLGAGIGQARDSLSGYGQGMSGYGKRLGSSMATATSADFFRTFLFSSLLRRDPRYFVSLHGGPWRRMGYGLSRLVVTRTDAGTEGVNWPGMLGPLFAESLANSYLPVKEQTAGRIFRRYGVRLGFTAGSNVLKEYWPTIFRSLRIARIAPGLRPDSAPTGGRPPSTPRPMR